MAELLKDQFTEEIPPKIADMLIAAGAEFDRQTFVNGCLEGYEDLELTQRARKISAQLAKSLPDDFNLSSKLIIQSLGPKLADADSFGMTVFIYLPYVYYAAEHGLRHFDAAMTLQYELTQRFTAEFSIRSYITEHPELTMVKLHEWVSDKSEHVRRLVSEGTRPLLPWASRLTAFKKDPEPVIALLEKLKDDESLYVRRSVANNLNDISKDHPERVNEIAQAWLKGASKDRQWLVRHALRGLIKKGNKATLALLGFSGSENIAVTDVKITPESAPIGGSVCIEFNLNNTGQKAKNLMLDYAIDYVKANGNKNRKVFKLKQLALEPKQGESFKKRVSLKQLTTRIHYPGEHDVNIMLNGNIVNLGKFTISE